MSAIVTTAYRDVLINERFSECPIEIVSILKVLPNRINMRASVYRLDDEYMPAFEFGWCRLQYFLGSLG